MKDLLPFISFQLRESVRLHGTPLSILIMKVNKMHSFSDLFDKVLYMFRTALLSIIRSISTLYTQQQVQGGSNMAGTDLYVNKPHCAAAVRP